MFRLIQMKSRCEFNHILDVVQCKRKKKNLIIIEFTLERKRSPEIRRWIKQFCKPSVSDISLISGSSDYSVSCQRQLIRVEKGILCWTSLGSALPPRLLFTLGLLFLLLTLSNNLSISLKSCKFHNFRNIFKGTSCIRSDLLWYININQDIIRREKWHSNLNRDHLTLKN